MNAKKSIILALPEDVGLSDLIIRNFEYHGFDVIHYHRQPYKYKKNIERIINFFRREVIGDKKYKNKQQDKEALERLRYEIDKRKTEIDYALFIRPDTFPIDFIKEIKTNVRKSVGYQWDGLDRFSDVFDRIEIFDDFYVFDSKDIAKYPQYNLKLTTNFYFDMDKNLGPIRKESEQTMYFIGSHLSQRVSAINQFTKSADKLGLQPYFLIGLDKKSENKKNLYDSHYIKFIRKGISYSENLNNVKNSDILIDFVNNIHSGLSFRIFESLFYQKKLITNNSEVINYDFYHENNIYIWDGENLDTDSLKEFLIKPYYNLSIDILEEYSFKNWHRLILGLSSN